MLIKRISLIFGHRHPNAIPFKKLQKAQTKVINNYSKWRKMEFPNFITVSQSFGLIVLRWWFYNFFIIYELRLKCSLFDFPTDVFQKQFLGCLFSLFWDFEAERAQNKSKRKTPFKIWLNNKFGIHVSPRYYFFY